MHTQIYRKFLFHISLLGLAASILIGFYDVIFHYIFEIAHLIFEMVESSLDKVVEHTFETELHETQMIVFYILVVLGAILIYFVWKFLVRVVRAARSNINSELTEVSSGIGADWHNFTAADKALAIGVFLLINLLAYFLLF